MRYHAKSMNIEKDTHRWCQQRMNARQECALQSCRRECHLASGRWLTDCSCSSRWGRGTTSWSGVFVSSLQHNSIESALWLCPAESSRAGSTASRLTDRKESPIVNKRRQ